MRILVFLLLLLIAASTTYNAYLLRGGKLAMSQILMVLGMLCLIFSQLLGVVGMENIVIYQLSLQNILFVLGFVFFLASSLKLRYAIK